MTIRDLTMKISPGMLVNPDHFAPEISRYATIAEQGWAGTRLVLDSHLGTHLDAPCHFIEGAGGVDSIDLDVLIGEAQVVHLEDISDDQAVSLDSALPGSSPRVLLATGWSSRTTEPGRYFGHFPQLTPETAEKLITAGVRLVGLDLPSPDRDGGIHTALLGAGCVIVENLVGLSELPAHCRLTILPLPVAGADGCPVRAVAEYD
jgi:arylformamidase